MSLVIGDNFSFLARKPLDGRIKYDTLADMVAMADSTLYDGCIAYCVGTDKTYQWKSSNAVDATLGKWREFESGGGASGDGGEMLTATLAAADWTNNEQTVEVTGVNAVSNGVIGMLNTATTAQLEAVRNAIITVTAVTDGHITFTCENVPSIDIPVGILIGGGSSGGDSVTVDSALSATSENPVQNKVVKSELDKKVDSVTGKGLSTNDYTDDEKDKLDGIEEGANKSEPLSADEIQAIKDAFDATTLVTPETASTYEIIDLRGTEKVIGKVIESDGTEKVLYRISKVATLPSSGLVDLGLDADYKVKNLRVVMSTSTNETVIGNAYISSGKPNYYFNNQNKLNYTDDGQFAGRSAEIIVDYIKG